tara:strand:- start:28059 stop:28445 length:387 start_codon:yes stop_codon:yes gene_type:complete
MKIKTPISVGELLDKISILKIKSFKIKDEEKLKNVKLELEYLNNIAKQKLDKYKNFDKRSEELYQVNASLWNIEDQIRVAEKRKDFDSEFVFLARSVYITNDKRFDIKNKINKECGSELKEEKSYEKY